MATLFNSIRSNNLTTALGGTVTAGDTVYLGESNDSYTAGVNFGSPATDLALLHMLPGWGGNIDGADLVVRASKMVAEWSGQVLRVSSNGAGVIGELQFAPARGGRGVFSACAVTTLYAAAGTLTLDDTVNAPTLTVVGGRVEARKSASHTVTTATVRGGVLVLSRDVGTLHQHGGETHIDDEACSPTAVNLEGGTLRVTRGGTIGTLTGGGGVLDLSELSRPLTVSAGTLGPKLTIRMPTNRGLVTLSATEVFGGPRYA